MFFRLAIRIRIAEDGDVRRVLLGQNECQAHVGKLYESLSLILVCDAAVEMVRVPFDRFFNNGDGHRRLDASYPVLKLLQLPPCRGTPFRFAARS